MGQNLESGSTLLHVLVTWFQQKCQENSMKIGESFQKMVLEQLVHMQQTKTNLKNLDTIYNSWLKIIIVSHVRAKIIKCQEENIREIFVTLGYAEFLHITLKGQSTEEKIVN